MIGAASVKVLPLMVWKEQRREDGRSIIIITIVTSFFIGNAVKQDNNIKKDCEQWKAGQDKCSAVLQKFSRMQKAVRGRNSVRGWQIDFR